MVANHKLSGPLHDWERARTAQIDCMSRKTLGALVGDLLGSYVVTDRVDPPEETKDKSSENVNWVTMQTSIVLSDEDFTRVEHELREMVDLRNRLVHHFIDQHDISSKDGCRGAQDALVIAESRIDQNLAKLREWAKRMNKAQQAMLDFFKSAEFEDWFINGIAPDGTVDWNAAGIVSDLQEAFVVMATEGWAPVVEAGKWIVERYPTQLPAKYGCNSWRQVVHEAPIFELRYFEMNGERTAYYREKKSHAKSL